MPGFSGEACEVGCLNGCSRRGQCTSDGVCECGGGWRGPDCSVPPIRLKGCKASCAATCSHQCEAESRAGHHASLVEAHVADGAGQAAGGFVWRGARGEDAWACAQACSAACVERCEDLQQDVEEFTASQW